MSPVVSVLMITYNHEKYIVQAIESALMQKTNFKFEIVIGEDCSTDKTREIVLEYKAKHSDTIKLQLQEKNVGMMQNFIDTLKVCTGKYIALLEGDDYWIDPYKLQKQVDFLEANPDCSLCFHPSKYIRADNPDKYFIKKPKRIPSDKKFGIRDVILGGGGFMATNSMVFLKEYINERPGWFDTAPVGDYPLMLLLASKGNIGYKDEVMSVYRMMASNSWSLTMLEKNKRTKYYQEVFKMLNNFDEWTQRRYHWIVERKKWKNKWNELKLNIIMSLKKIIKELFNKSNIYNSDSYN